MRIVLGFSACYFDDFWKLAWKVIADASKTRFDVIIGIFGAELAKEKSEEMRTASRSSACTLMPSTSPKAQ